jgi:hypothetical protein
VCVTHVVVAITAEALHGAEGEVLRLDDVRAIVRIRPSEGPGETVDDLVTGAVAAILVLVATLTVALGRSLAEKDTQIGVR